MNFRMDEPLRFWVDCSYEDKKYEDVNRTKMELIAEILREYERSGDAMRHLNANGQIAWKASPWMLSRLADAEREAKDVLESIGQGTLKSCKLAEIYAVRSARLRL
jgi:predicted transcriptional regulator